MVASLRLERSQEGACVKLAQLRSEKATVEACLGPTSSLAAPVRGWPELHATTSELCEESVMIIQVMP